MRLATGATRWQNGLKTSSSGAEIKAETSAYPGLTISYRETELIELATNGRNVSGVPLKAPLRGAVLFTQLGLGLNIFARHSLGGC